MILIDTRAVIHATIAANKEWYKLILISELLIKSKLVKTKDAKIMGIDKSIEKIAADDLSNPKKTRSSNCNTCSTCPRYKS